MYVHKLITKVSECIDVGVLNSNQLLLLAEGYGNNICVLVCVDFTARSTVTAVII